MNSRFRLYLIVILVFLSPAIQAEVLSEVHFLIPAGPGGGWDGTARGVGEAMVRSDLITRISYENLSGGGGGRAIAKLIETADRQQSTLLVSSTPMVVRSLQKIFPQSFRDIQPIASVIADYSCFVVSKKSSLQTWQDVVATFQADPRSVKVAGGSVRGSTDHIVFARAMELAGGDPFKVVYVPYDGGGKAMAGILTGESRILSTGLGEAIDMARAGEVRILAVTAGSRLSAMPDVPTLRELGIALEFANWRGFFAAPGLDPSRYAAMQETLARLLETEAFERVRARNGWTVLHYEGDAFYDFLERQEQEIGDLMRQLGFLRP
ncbi:MAG: tripartite tricarboxylate transporter substrate-binding protein [Pseudomonadales bacterium]